MAARVLAPMTSVWCRWTVAPRRTTQGARGGGSASCCSHNDWPVMLRKKVPQGTVD